jgi:hypothetical protein
MGQERFADIVERFAAGYADAAAVSPEGIRQGLAALELHAVHLLRVTNAVVCHPRLDAWC